MFVTPNMLDDGHDTSIDYAASWLQYWLVPLLKNSNFNDNGTLVVLTFDENESYTENNCVLTLLLGGAIPESAWGTTDSTYYTHYSLLSTVQANWGLQSLGRGDTNKYVSRGLPLHTHARLVNLTTSHTGPSRTSSPSSLQVQDIKTWTFLVPMSSRTLPVWYPARSTRICMYPSPRQTPLPSELVADLSLSVPV